MCNITFLPFITIFIFITACSPSNRERTATSSALIEQTLSNPDFEWMLSPTEDFEIYSIKESYASEHIDKLKIGLVSASESIISRFDLEKPAEKTSIFFIDSREQMQKLVGHLAGGWAAVRDHAIFYVANSTNKPQLKHELGHLYTWTNWGDPYHYWLSEGMAVLSSGNCKDENFHAWAALLKKDNKLVDISTLELSEFNFSKVEPHLQAASFISFLHEAYGLKTLKEIWKAGIIKWANAEKLDLNNIQNSWLLKVTNYYDPSLQLQEKMYCE